MVTPVRWKSDDGQKPRPVLPTGDGGAVAGPLVGPEGLMEGGEDELTKGRAALFD